jgi:hypothetical protein
MNIDLTNSKFENIQCDESVISRSSVSCGEYITALYSTAGEFIAERVIYKDTFTYTFIA